jgi:large subunit ribosomal protein L4
MEVKKWTIEGKESGVITLNDTVFATKAHPQTITDVVKAQLNNARQGTVKTKTRAEVAGGGRKPWRQKGTGRARAGSIRSPLWPGGGSTFGPRPHIYDHRPPKKVVDRAVTGALAELTKNNRVYVVEKLGFESGKCKDIVAFLKKMNMERALIVVPTVTENLKRASRNMKNVKVVTPTQVNTVDLLKYGHMAISAEAVKSLEEVLSS